MLFFVKFLKIFWNLFEIPDFQISQVENSHSGVEKTLLTCSRGLHAIRHHIFCIMLKFPCIQNYPAKHIIFRATQGYGIIFKQYPTKNYLPRPHLNDQSLIRKPFSERRLMLEKCFQKQTNPTFLKKSLRNISAAACEPQFVLHESFIDTPGEFQFAHHKDSCAERRSLLWGSLPPQN